MSDPSSKSSQMTFGDIGNAISSQESESGATPSGSQDGQTIENAGQARVRAPRSQAPARSKCALSAQTAALCGALDELATQYAEIAGTHGLPTNGTYSRSGGGSLFDEDLSASLVSRLRTVTESLGSSLFEHRWKLQATILGPSIYRLRALALPTGDKGYSSWPTPQSSDMTGGGQAKRSEGRANLNDFAMLAGWGTPAARDWKSGDASQKTLERNARPLTELAMLAGWKTPCVPNGGRISGNRADIGKHLDGTKAQVGLENETKLSGWATPAKADGIRSIETMMGGNLTLLGQARLGSWATPKVASGDYQHDSGGNPILNLSGQAQLTAFGETPIGFLLGRKGWEIVPASGQLSAQHSRWLMSLPKEWDEAAIAAFRSLKAKKRGS